MTSALQTRRQSMGITQSEAAQRIGISRSLYSMYEYGTVPPVDKAIVIATALDSTVEELFGAAPPTDTDTLHGENHA